MSLEILIATNNLHKVQEYKSLLSPHNICVHSLKEMNIVDDAIEDGDSYHENSLIKARSVARFTSMPVLADDSGIEIEAFGTFPGIHSARFAKQCGGSNEANKEILKRLESENNRSATFSCVITLVNIEKEPLQFKGVCPGYILDDIKGNEGFGYDPIFYSNEANIAFGEASETIKNEYSHRAKACKLLIAYLKEHKII